MTALLDWFSQHQQALTLLGSGAATALSGVWVAICYFFPRKGDGGGKDGGSKGGNQSKSSSRNTTGIGGEGDTSVINSTIHISQNPHPALVLLAGATLVFVVAAVQKWAERPALPPAAEQHPPGSISAAPSMITIEDGRRTSPQRMYQLEGKIIQQP